MILRSLAELYTYHFVAKIVDEPRGGHLLRLARLLHRLSDDFLHGVKTNLLDIIGVVMVVCDWLTALVGAEPVQFGLRRILH